MKTHHLIERTVRELQAERDRLTSMIAALERISENGTSIPRRGPITAAERRAAAERMRAYWRKKREAKGEIVETTPTSSD